jgi:hypothetical protein
MCLEIEETPDGREEDWEDETGEGTKDGEENDEEELTCGGYPSKELDLLYGLLDFPPEREE